jgi:hypothetical protein
MESSTRTHQQYGENSLFQRPKTLETKHDSIIPIILWQSYQKDYTTLTDKTQIKKLYFFNKTINSHNGEVALCESPAIRT